MADEQTDNVMMIGPTQAGKTTLLSALRLASARKIKGTGRVGIEPVNDAATELFERALEIVNDGNFNLPATPDATRYEFTLTCDVEERVWVEEFEEVPGGLFGFGKPKRVDKSRYEVRLVNKAFQLTVMDGRGGDIFGSPDRDDPAEYRRRRGELIEMASRSAGLVVCVDAGDERSTGAFFLGLQRFLDDVKRSGKRLPFQRVAIALTKADRLVEQYGSSALTTLRDKDPAAAAAEVMGFYARSALFGALDSAARIRAGWVSVYGFIRDEGSVNFDSAANRVATFRPNARWTDDWVPFGVIEPLLYACTGEPIGLMPVTDTAD